MYWMICILSSHCPQPRSAAWHSRAHVIWTVSAGRRGALGKREPKGPTQPSSWPSTSWAEGEQTAAASTWNKQSSSASILKASPLDLESHRFHKLMIKTPTLMSPCHSHTSTCQACWYELQKNLWFARSFTKLHVSSDLAYLDSDPHVKCLQAAFSPAKRKMHSWNIKPLMSSQHVHMRKLAHDDLQRNCKLQKYGLSSSDCSPSPNTVPW